MHHPCACMQSSRQGAASRQTREPRIARRHLAAWRVSEIIEEPLPQDLQGLELHTAARFRSTASLAAGRQVSPAQPGACCQQSVTCHSSETAGGISQCAKFPQIMAGVQDVILSLCDDDRRKSAASANTRRITTGQVRVSCKLGRWPAGKALAARHSTGHQVTLRSSGAEPAIKQADSRAQAQPCAQTSSARVRGWSRPLRCHPRQHSLQAPPLAPRHLAGVQHGAS